MPKITMDQLELMTVAQLTKFYNDHCTIANKEPVKKFKDKPTGAKRCLELVELKARLDAEKKPKVAKPAAPKVIVRAAGISVSRRCRDLIAAGKTNEEIWAIIQPEFGLDDGKKSYPAWNRSQIKRSAATPSAQPAETEAPKRTRRSASAAVAA